MGKWRQILGYVERRINARRRKVSLFNFNNLSNRFYIFDIFQLIYRFTWSNGEIYIGEWMHGKMCGKGQKVQIDGSMLDGLFNSGKLHGWGNKTFIEGDHFEGLFENDSRHGYGEYSWFDGSRYCGLWSRDDAHGVGTMVRGHYAGDRFDSIGLKIGNSQPINIFRLSTEE